jgi:NTE family protein
MAFHLGCLRALNDLGVLERIGVMSTISGGSVIGAYYAYTPEKSFSEFDSDICTFLRRGFQRGILLDLLEPANLFHCALNQAVTKIDGFLSKINRKQPDVRRNFSRTEIFYHLLQRELFHGLNMQSPRRGNLNLVIGSCDLRTGAAFRFGNDISGDWRHGRIMEDSVDVGFAVAASAAYPIFLPPLDRTWTFNKEGHETEHRILLTDGGIYDNLGLQVLEPGRDPKFSLHTFPCEWLIVCNAGQGQESGDSVPLGLLPRVIQSFEVVHRRVQESTMNRLHNLSQTGEIKGFVMPYLGQQDEALPFKPSNFITRAEVVDYATNFAAMNDEWICKLASRGEQLTRLLVEWYISSVL